MNKDQLSQLARRIFSSNRGLRSPQLMHPAREWLVGFTLGIGIFVASVIWSVLMYTEYRDLSTEGAPMEEEIVVYRESMVESALDQLRKRTVVYEEYLRVAEEQQVSREVQEGVKTEEEETAEVPLEEEVVSDSETGSPLEEAVVQESEVESQSTSTAEVLIVE
jgi:hypothetical protein